MIELCDVSFSYSHSKRPLIKGLSLLIRTGVITGLIGPNGSGKSTLLKLAAGLLTPGEGRVLLNGQDIRRVDRRLRAQKIAWLRQSPSAPPLQALDVVLSGRYPHRGLGMRYSPQDHALARRAMEQAGCGRLADKRMNRLSGGERQKVFMAAALAQQTDAILLDEPTAHLDIGSAIEWMHSLRVLVGGSDRAVAIVLHDLDLALRFCDYLYVVECGALAAQGAPDALVQGGALAQVFRTEVTCCHSNGRQYYCFG